MPPAPASDRVTDAPTSKSQVTRFFGSAAVQVYAPGLTRTVSPATAAATAAPGVAKGRLDCPRVPDVSDPLVPSTHSVLPVAAFSSIRASNPSAVSTAETGVPTGQSTA